MGILEKGTFSSIIRQIWHISSLHSSYGWQHNFRFVFEHFYDLVWGGLMALCWWCLESSVSNFGSSLKVFLGGFV